MTSKPASRSARATTLAPRSCPSRPGLATRMRSLASVMFRSPRLWLEGGVGFRGGRWVSLFDPEVGDVKLGPLACREKWVPFGQPPGKNALSVGAPDEGGQRFPAKRELDV